jgi:hypothetical protein
MSSQYESCLERSQVSFSIVPHFFNQFGSLRQFAKIWRERLLQYHNRLAAFRITLCVADAVFVGVVLAAAAYGIFSFPYNFPPSLPSADSISYVMGFNNRVAMMVVLATIAVLSIRLFLWQWFRPEKIESILCVTPGQKVKMPKSVLLLMIAIYIGIICATYSVVPQLDEYDEARGIVPKLELAVRYHFIPYVNFQWNYGILLFYVPLVTTRIVSLAGGSIQLGYCSGYIILSSLSLLALFYLIDQFSIKMAYRALIFAVIASLYFDVSFAPQGVLMRFLAPLVALIVLHRFQLRAGRAMSQRAVVIFSGICILCNLAVLSIGMEIGIPHAIAQVFYCLYAAIRAGRSRLYGAGASLVGVPVFLLLFPGSIRMLLRFSGGYGNTPVFISMFSIAYLLCIMWLVPILVGSGMAPRSGPNAPLAVAFAAIVVMQMPYCLGRCDLGHLRAGGLAAYILTLAIVVKKRPIAFPGSLVLLILIFGIAYHSIYMYMAFPRLLPGIAGQTSAVAVTESSLVAPLALEKYPSIATPFGIDRATKAFLMKTGRFVPEYFTDFGEICTEPDIDRTFNDCAKAAVVLVPENIPALRNVTVDMLLRNWEMNKSRQDETVNQFQSMLALAPVHYRSKHMPYDPVMELARRIASLYVPVDSAGGWVVMKHQ